MENNNNRSDLDEESMQNKGIDLERIRNAKKRRIVQLKKWSHYDKMKEREESSRQRKGFPPVKKGTKSVTFCQNLILLEAGNSGDADEVRKLLSKGVCADVANSDGLTALHQCAINNNMDMCRILIHYKANVNAKDKELWTPLHAAAICGNSDICQLLIKNGADLLALNADGNMPYDICEDEQTLDIIENEMASKGITQEQINITRNIPELTMLNDIKAVVGKMGQAAAVQMMSVLDRQGANQLHIAATCGYVEVTRLLLSVGMPIDALDKDGWQAIHVAALHSHLEVIEVLVSHGANIDCQTKQGETVYELVFDGEVYEKLLLLKQEIDKLKENQNLTASFGLVRRRSSTNPRSASIRRTSMKEKSFLSWKEARLEAEIRRSIERKNPSDNGQPSPATNHVAPHGIDARENHNINNRDGFINSSLRGKAFALAESIAETDYGEPELPSLDPDDVDVDLYDPYQKPWALPGMANRNEKPNFTHPHPYNSPTRDPNTFPYNPKPSTNSSNSSSSISQPPQRHHKTLPDPIKPKPTGEFTAYPNRQRPSSSSSEKPTKKSGTLPHMHHDPDEVTVDGKPQSLRLTSGKHMPAPPKSPNSSHKHVAPMSSGNSVKTGSSGHTTPINTPRSSQNLSDHHRKHNRQVIKPMNNKSHKAARPDSCCSVM